DVMAVRGAAVEFLEEAAPVHRDQLERRLDGLSSRAEALGTSKPRGDGDALDVLESALEEVGPLVAALRRVIGLREQANWNVGLAYRSEVGPRFQRIRDATIELRSAQGQAMVVAARGASFGTTGVVGLALLVGFISASGLYYSIRLEHRMKEIASKAQMLGQYAIEAPLGGGGMGDVYRAKHALLRRPTAIKLLRRGAELNPRAQERFREEVQLTSQLTHPNTIQVFDYGRTPDGVLYYAMELLEGVDLDALVRQRGPLAPSRAVCVLTQICGSLAEAHALGLLHRDLKPSNIMLTQRGGQWDVAKVLDFGLAARMGMDTSGGQGLVGTPSYMAPEIIEHPDAASVRSDLYAVGCIGYFLLTGTSVFPSDDVETTLDRHRHEAPVRPSERLGRALPEALEAVVLGCLEKSPEDRPASAQRLGQLFAASVEEPWTPADAEAWWSDYGEAIQAEARANAAQGETPAG
ncbi:MAG: serine/threonine-protein kinase, partial [Myxococcota bacterium]